jgi:hypothetical protein
VVANAEWQPTTWCARGIHNDHALRVYPCSTAVQPGHHIGCGSSPSSQRCSTSVSLKYQCLTQVPTSHSSSSVSLKYQRLTQVSHSSTSVSLNYQRLTQVASHSITSVSLKYQRPTQVPASHSSSVSLKYQRLTQVFPVAVIHDMPRQQSRSSLTAVLRTRPLRKPSPVLGTPHSALLPTPKGLYPLFSPLRGILYACIRSGTPLPRRESSGTSLSRTVFVKAQTGPNSWKCDPYVVLDGSTSGLHGGHTLALTRSVLSRAPVTGVQNVDPLAKLWPLAGAPGNSACECHR